MTPREGATVTLAVLPVKRFDAAKQRLGDGLTGGTRRALAESMLTDVLMALRRTTAIDDVLLVTCEPAADAIGRGYGAQVVVDSEDNGQSAAATVGVDRALEAGATRVVLVAGDCPALDPAELTTLLAQPAFGRGVTLVPDRHGTGTNALVLMPPGVIEPAFGEDSRARHEAAAARAGVPCTVEEHPTLALDIDTPEDLVELRRMLAERRGGAAHTRGMLSRLAGRDGAAGPAEERGPG